MGMPIARMSDVFCGSCTAHPEVGSTIPTAGPIAGGAPLVQAGMLSVARMSDSVTAGCGHPAIINGGSPTVTAGGMMVARLGDAILGATITGVIVSGMPTVLVG